VLVGAIFSAAIIRSILDIFAVLSSSWRSSLGLFDEV